MTLFKDMLLQIFVILCPFLLYQPYEASVRKYIRSEVAVKTFLYALSLLLCLLFTVTPVNGYLFDLRAIPLSLAVFYDGPLVGSLLFLLFALYRLVIGGAGAVPAILVALLQLLTAVAASRFYRRASHPRKLWIVAFVLTLYAVYREGSVILFLDAQVFWNNVWFHTVTLPGMQIVGGALTVILVESYSRQKSLENTYQRNEKIQVAAQLSAAIAHEVRNPLTVVKGFLKMYTQTDSASKRDQYIDTAREEVERAETIINEYLSLTRNTNSEEPQGRLDVGELVERSVRALSGYSLLHGVDVSVEAEDQCCYIRANAGQMMQVLVNIGKNAVEASKVKNGGQVLFRILMRKDRGIIEISDNGVGMTKEELDRLGNAFFTKKDAGTGLGLMVCYHLVESMGGSIEVDSTFGKGSTFRILLPVCSVERNRRAGHLALHN